MAETESDLEKPIEPEKPETWKRPKTTTMEKVQKAGPYINTLSVETALMALDDRFHFELTRTELAILGPLIAGAIHIVWRLGKPIAKAVYRKILAAVGAILAASLISGTTYATDVRVDLVCTSTVTRLEEVPEVGVRETEVCVESEAWLDLTVGFDVFALQLTGERDVVSLGAAPALGALIAWRPSWWTGTPLLVGGELTLAMTLISPELAEGQATHVEIWTIAGLNLLGWFAIGIGGRYGLAVRDEVSDFARLVLTGGIRVPI